MENIILITIILMFLTVIFIMACAKNVPYDKVFVIERRGKYSRILKGNVHIVLPFIDKIVRIIRILPVVKDFPAQPIVTKDNHTLISQITYGITVTDPVKYTYEIEKPLIHLQEEIIYKVRKDLGDKMPDEILMNSDSISSYLTHYFDGYFDNIGINLDFLNIKFVKIDDIPKNININDYVL